jgi:uncharacterized protein
LELVLGGGAVVIASFLGGATGFGFALICTPLLLLIGFPLEFVITANLTLTMITRLSVAYRFRAHVSLRRVSMLIVGSIPGFYLGANDLKLFCGASLVCGCLAGHGIRSQTLF